MARNARRACSDPTTAIMSIASNRNAGVRLASMPSSTQGDFGGIGPKAPYTPSLAGHEGLADGVNLAIGFLTYEFIDDC